MEAIWAKCPFYAARMDDGGAVRPWTLDDLEDWAAAHDDPYGGRRVEDRLPPLSLQLEASDDPYLWVGVDAGELGRWSAALERLLARWGVGAGDTVAYFEYGSSPLVLLSAGSYVPHLAGGAVDRLGADTYCNDGLASMAIRMVDALRRLRPAAVVLRADVLAPFAEAVDVTGLALAEVAGHVAVTVPEGAPFPAEVARYAERWGMAVRGLLRADAAFLVAGDCDHCGLFHVDPDLYRLEPAPDGTAVTASFAHTTPAVNHLLEGWVQEPAGCPEEPPAPRLVRARPAAPGTTRA
ncbi:MAG: hypothetical protein ACRDYV_06565 [Acidimicrobiia bacterium]